MSTPEMRMNAYYFGFNPTGELSIDKILSAVACAGKAYHHTESWTDGPDEPWPPHTGSNTVEWIQNAAKEAAANTAALHAEIARLRSDRDALREALEGYAGCCDGCTCGDGWSHDSARAALAASGGTGT